MKEANDEFEVMVKLTIAILRDLGTNTSMEICDFWEALLAKKTSDSPKEEKAE